VARNRRLILSSPSEVWDLLSDGHRYGEWVSGTQQVTAADPHWPEVGARLQVRVGLGPLVLDDTCVVRICEPRRRLGLEAKADPFGAARIAMNLIPGARTPSSSSTGIRCGVPASGCTASRWTTSSRSATA
jgi:hypothetical protein